MGHDISTISMKVILGNIVETVPSNGAIIRQSNI